MGEIKENPAWGRRLFLKAVAAGGFLLGLPGLAWGFILKKFPVRTVEKDEFLFEPSLGAVKWKSGRTEPFILRVDGLVEEPLELSYEELRALPQVSQTSDFHCVEGWSVQDLTWGGVRFQEILNRVKVKPEGKFVIFHSLGETSHKPKGRDHYTESFPVEALLDPKKEALLALDLDGKPLPHDHGAPMRVISPYDLAYKNIKYVTRIEFADSLEPGWWTAANPIYPVKAPVPRHRLRN